jgi:hypothetical protein
MVLVSVQMDMVVLIARSSTAQTYRTTTALFVQEMDTVCYQTFASVRSLIQEQTAR